jgi:hypothetical protein
MQGAKEQICCASGFSLKDMALKSICDHQDAGLFLKMAMSALERSAIAPFAAAERIAIIPEEQHLPLFSPIPPDSCFLN